MTLKQEVLEHKTIFSLMYSPNFVDFRSLEDQIIEIEVSDLKWYENEEGFIYIWGWPGPDFNEYTRETYGRGWAYTKEEIYNSWNEDF